MNKLFFDTETNGLPKNYNLSWDSSDNWPRMIQIAYIHSFGTWIEVRQEIIKPELFEIKKEVQDLTGISQEIAESKWEAIEWILLYFYWIIINSDEIIGHNIDFDINVLISEYARAYEKTWDIRFKQAIEKLEMTKKTCTMKDYRIIDFCAIQWPYGNKWPKLKELYKKLFWEEFDNQHTALADIRATEACYYELKKIWII